MKISFEIPGVPKLPNEMLYRHWRIKHQEAKRWKNLVRAYAASKWLGRDALKKARITLTRYSSREPDADNLMASWKHVIDGIVDAGVIENDKPSCIGTPVSLWQKAKTKENKITVTVEKLPDPA